MEQTTTLEDCKAQLDGHNFMFLSQAGGLVQVPQKLEIVLAQLSPSALKLGNKSFG